jgi:hypothetical protein
VLVGAVFAVVLAVAPPLLVDAEPVVAPVAVVRTRVAAVRLVGTVGAVGLAVALPLQVDADLGVGALELVLLAVGVAVGLVGAVVALELAVAFLRPPDAPSSNKIRLRKHYIYFF